MPPKVMRKKNGSRTALSLLKERPTQLFPVAWTTKSFMIHSNDNMNKREEKRSGLYEGQVNESSKCSSRRLMRLKETFSLLVYYGRVLVWRQNDALTLYVYGNKKERVRAASLQFQSTWKGETKRQHIEKQMGLMFYIILPRFSLSLQLSFACSWSLM